MFSVMHGVTYMGQPIALLAVSTCNALLYSLSDRSMLKPRIVMLMNYLIESMDLYYLAV